MATIDLSQAKIGDKFRAMDGSILTYKRFVSISHECYYELTLDNDYRYFYNRDGRCTLGSAYDLFEQVLDKPLDELIEEATKQFRENDDAIAEENELQRRQKVVELADRIFFSDRGNIYSFKECVEIAEYSVNIRNQYLNEGKLC